MFKTTTHILKPFNYERNLILKENEERFKIPHEFTQGEYLECDFCGHNKEEHNYYDRN